METNPVRDEQKRMAEHIEQGYEKRGVSEDEAERGRGPPSTRRPTAERKAALLEAKKRITLPHERAVTSEVRPRPNRPAKARSASAKKAARTRKKHAA